MAKYRLLGLELVHVHLLTSNTPTPGQFCFTRSVVGHHCVDALRIVRLVRLIRPFIVNSPEAAHEVDKYCVK